MFLRPVRKIEHLTLYSEVAGDTSWPTGKKKERERKDRSKRKGDVCSRGKSCRFSALRAPNGPLPSPSCFDCLISGEPEKSSCTCLPGPRCVRDAAGQAQRQPHAGAYCW